MANAPRDDNRIPTLLAVSNVDGTTPVVLYADPVTHRLLVSSSVTPGGADTQVQFNDGGSINGDAGMTYNKTTDTLTLAGHLNAETVRIEDSDASHYLVIITSSNLTANRNLTLVTGDAARTITINGDVTLNDWFDQAVKAASSPSFAGVTLSGTSTPLNAKNTTDGASVQVAVLEGDRATMANNDEAYISLKLSDSAGNQDEFARLTWKATTVTSTSEEGRLQFGIVSGGSLADEMYLTPSALTPASSDGLALGTTALMWSDLFLASGAVVNFNNGDVTLTHSANLLTLAGGQFSFGANTAYFTETDNGNSGASDTIDWTLSNKQKSTLTANCTFTFTAPGGPCNLVLKLVQDGTGSRTVTWPAAVHWSGGVAPTLTTTASRVDIINFYYDGSTYFGAASLNYVA